MPKTRDLIRSYVSDLDAGDLFSIDDVMAWFKEMWPKFTPSSNCIGCVIRSLGNVQIIGGGIYKVVA